MILATATLICVGLAAAQSPQVPGNQWVLDYVTADNDGYGGSVFRVGVGARQLLWEGASGELQHNGAAMTVDANFEIASVTKAFTAAAALTMVEDGLLQLDAPLGNYVPRSMTDGLLVINNVEYGHTLTIRQLLQHTSGLPDYWNDPPFVIGIFNRFLLDYSLAPQHFWSPTEIMSYVPDLDPRFLPGTGWHYNDSGFVIIGMLIERITGLPLEQVFRDRIFVPLGLTDTWLHWREPQVGSLPESHRYEDGSYDMYIRRHNSADWAGGGLVSSTRDLQLFIHGLAGGDLFRNQSTLDEMMSWIPTGEVDVEYGLGLFRVDLGFGLGHVWGHDGYGNSWMYYWPRHDITFSGTLNQSRNDLWVLIMAAALRIEYL
jgi:D-alanyl-D-alanine carboxypeptidase